VLGGATLFSSSSSFFFQKKTKKKTSRPRCSCSLFALFLESTHTQDTKEKNWSHWQKQKAWCGSKPPWTPADDQKKSWAKKNGASDETTKKPHAM